MKKILFSTYDDIKNPHYAGGGARAIHEIAKRLAKKYDIEVISWNHSGVKYETIDGVRYARIGTPYCNPKLGNLLFQISLPLIVMMRQFDLWIESFGPPFTTSYLPLFTRKPVLGVVHMLSSDDMKRKYKISLSGIENRGLRLYKSIVATSTSLKSTIKKITPNSKISVIGNGIPSVYEGPINFGKYFLFLGRIEIDQKGIDLLLQSFDVFKKTDKSNYRLVIAGFGSSAEEKVLKAKIAKSEYKKSISFRGRVEGRARHNLYKNAACVLVPSRFETFSMVALEALSYGKPVVAYDIRGLKWLPQTASLKVKAFDVNLFANGMRIIVGNGKQAIKSARLGKEYARKYTWDILSDKYHALLSTLLK